MGIEATEDTEAANSGFEGTIEAANKAADGHRQLATKEEVVLRNTISKVWINNWGSMITDE